MCPNPPYDDTVIRYGPGLKADSPVTQRRAHHFSVNEGSVVVSPNRSPGLGGQTVGPSPSSSGSGSRRKLFIILGDAGEGSISGLAKSIVHGKVDGTHFFGTVGEKFSLHPKKLTDDASIPGFTRIQEGSTRHRTVSIQEGSTHPEPITGTHQGSALDALGGATDKTSEEWHDLDALEAVTREWDTVPSRTQVDSKTTSCMEPLPRKTKAAQGNMFSVAKNKLAISLETGPPACLGDGQPRVGSSVVVESDPEGASGLGSPLGTTLLMLT